MTLNVGLAQIAPVWLDRQASVQKVSDYIGRAAESNCDLVCFGEALIPGYPFWLEHTGGARFDDDFQKRMYALYAEQAVDIEAGDLQEIQQRCWDSGIACYLGVIERAHDRSGHSLYCTLVYLDKAGQIQSTHRKLMPTYEERPGVGHRRWQRPESSSARRVHRWRP